MDPANAVPPQEEKKEAVINVKVKGADNNEVYFKIKPNTQIRKVFDAYCERVGKAPNTVRFCLDGVRINGNSTAEQLNLQNDDTIDAMPEQTGGSL